MTVAWPSDLPQTLLIDGNSFGTPDGRLRSQTDTGPAKVRPRSSAMVQPVAGTMLMTSAQLAILETFTGPSGDSAGGSLPFTFPAPYGGGDWLVRFADSLPGKQNLGGDTWQVSLQFEKLP